MKLLFFICSLFMLSCSAQGKNEPDWDDLILATGYVEKISDLTAFQLDFLENIKVSFKEQEKKAALEAQKMLDEFYEDTNPIEEILLSGLTLPEDNTSAVWELYFESMGVDKNGDDKDFAAIIMFEGTKIIGTSSVH